MARRKQRAWQGRRRGVYSRSPLTATARLAGIVQGVVVQITTRSSSLSLTYGSSAAVGFVT